MGASSSRQSSPRVQTEYRPSYSSLFHSVNSPREDMLWAITGLQDSREPLKRFFANLLSLIDETEKRNEYTRSFHSHPDTLGVLEIDNRIQSFLASIKEKIKKVEPAVQNSILFDEAVKSLNAILREISEELKALTLLYIFEVEARVDDKSKDYILILYSLFTKYRFNLNKLLVKQVSEDLEEFLQKVFEKIINATSSIRENLRRDNVNHRVKECLPQINKNLKILVNELFDPLLESINSVSPQVNRIHKLIQNRINFIQDEGETFEEKLEALNILEEATSAHAALYNLLFIKPKYKEVCPEREICLYAEQRMLKYEEQLKIKFFSFLKNQLAPILLDNSLPCCFISYAWPSDEFAEAEKNIAPFLENLHADLRLCGIHTRLDRVDAKPNVGVYSFMDNLYSVGCCLIIGTQSLLEKHKKGTTAVCNELILINRLKNDGQIKVIPILISGSIEVSFPPYFCMYNTITNWREKSYLKNLMLLVRVICDIGNDSKSYNDCWNNFFADLEPCFHEGLEVPRAEEYLHSYQGISLRPK